MPRLVPAVLLLTLLAACGKAKDSADLPADLGSSLQPAFLTAFGSEAPADHAIVRAGKTVDVAYAPEVIARLSDDEVALGSLAAPSDNSCNGCTWSVAVHYLTAKDNRFTVEKSF